MSDLLLNDWFYFLVALPIALLAATMANLPLLIETWQMHKRVRNCAGGRAFVRFLAEVVGLSK